MAGSGWPRSCRAELAKSPAVGASVPAAGGASHAVGTAAPDLNAARAEVSYNSLNKLFTNRERLARTPLRGAMLKKFRG